MFLYLIIYDLGQVSVVLFDKFLITLVLSEKIGNVNIHINMPMLVCMFGTGKQKLGNNVYETDVLCMGIREKDPRWHLILGPISAVVAIF